MRRRGNSERNFYVSHSVTLYGEGRRSTPGHTAFWHLRLPTAQLRLLHAVQSAPRGGGMVEQQTKQTTTKRKPSRQITQVRAPTLSGWAAARRAVTAGRPRGAGSRMCGRCGLCFVNQQIPPRILRRRQGEPFPCTRAHGRGGSSEPAAHQERNWVARQVNHLTV